MAWIITSEPFFTAYRHAELLLGSKARLEVARRCSLNCLGGELNEELADDDGPDAPSRFLERHHPPTK